MDDNDKKEEEEERINRGSCWMQDRPVDRLLILVVDALRFDFAKERLPASIGKYLKEDIVMAETKDINNNINNNNDHKHQRHHHHHYSSSQLLQFVADPPTVTMQRLKGMTTGGLPTFADISQNFGGATIDEDSWVQQYADSYYYDSDDNDEKKEKEEEDGKLWKHKKHPFAAFVGDDTWMDLYPTQFQDAHPFPSFNTRDLDTVDNGCLAELPRMLQEMQDDDSHQLLVAHFLGVDHVGHTYGPDDPHMTMKLQQVDSILATTLDLVNDPTRMPGCTVTVVLGDHGMTPDGNHGGGTKEEVGAGLFVHTSPHCGQHRHTNKSRNSRRSRSRSSSNGAGDNDDEEDDDVAALGLEEDESGTIGTTITHDQKEEEAHHAEDVLQVMSQEYGEWSRTVFFESMHQIDLVPVISLWLGLPIPFANLGGLVPSISLLHGRDMVLGFAWNAAQVWRYLKLYHETANRLPGLDELQDLFQDAVHIYQIALQSDVTISLSRDEEEEEQQQQQQQQQRPLTAEHRQAAVKFKLFLNEATELGKRVWTKFDAVGMMGGVTILVLILLGRLIVTVRQSLRSSVSSSSSAGATTTTTVSLGRRLRDWVVTFLSAVQVMVTLSLPRFISVVFTTLFMVFHTIVITFSNSYIAMEQQISMYFLAVLALILTWETMDGNAATTTTTTRVRRTTTSRPYHRGQQQEPYHRGQQQEQQQRRSWWPIMMIPIFARLHELLVHGHGLDPSIRLYGAHQCLVFWSCLVVILGTRLWWNQFGYHLLSFSRRNHHRVRPTMITLISALDIITILSLAVAWYEKRTVDTSRNGYLPIRVTIISWLISNMILLLDTLLIQYDQKRQVVRRPSKWDAIYQSLVGMMIVTGPSLSSTVVFFGLQVYCWSILVPPSSSSSSSSSVPTLSPWISAALLRLIIRHAFFATNHACAFNRLQYSAAFVSTMEFHFVLGGVSLFFNTFGWEVIGLLLVRQTTIASFKQTTNEQQLMMVTTIYSLYQLMETTGACLSVSLMRRHLMVWAIFAPRFLFAAIFWVLHVGIGTVLCDTIMPFLPLLLRWQPRQNVNNLDHDDNKAKGIVDEDEDEDDAEIRRGTNNSSFLTTRSTIPSSKKAAKLVKI